MQELAELSLAAPVFLKVLTPVGPWDTRSCSCETPNVPACPQGPSVRGSQAQSKITMLWHVEEGSGGECSLQGPRMTSCQDWCLHQSGRGC